MKFEEYSEAQRKKRELLDSLIYRLVEAKGREVEHIQYQLHELHKQLEEKEK